jgi:hypothetical protein
MTKKFDKYYKKIKNKNLLLVGGEGVQSILHDGGLDRGCEVLETGEQDVAP